MVVSLVPEKFTILDFFHISNPIYRLEDGPEGFFVACAPLFSRFIIIPGI